MYIIKIFNCIKNTILTVYFIFLKPIKCYSLEHYYCVLKFKKIIYLLISINKLIENCDFMFRFKIIFSYDSLFVYYCFIIIIIIYSFFVARLNFLSLFITLF